MNIELFQEIKKEIIDNIKIKLDKNFLLSVYTLEDDIYKLQDGLSSEQLEKTIKTLKKISYLKYQSIDELSERLREELEKKSYILLYAYNRTGKTRLSMAFKDIGKTEDSRDTLYFNAFTEDLFFWDNDLEYDSQRVLKINSDSAFFNGLNELEMENRIRPLYQRYSDIDFTIDYTNWSINFSKEVPNPDYDSSIEISEENTVNKIEDNIKISRGEESIFTWCFFLAVAQLAIDEQEAYDWVKFIYVDDPISSLDDNNAIAVASHLAQILKKQEKIKVIVSSHHSLFFNVMHNELKKALPYFLTKNDDGYTLKDTGDTPFFNHVSMLQVLDKADKSGELYTYHFNILRNILEKTASFLGLKNFSDCIRIETDDLDKVIHTRMVNILSHGNYSLFDPMEMVGENKEYFSKIFNNFKDDYKFNRELFNHEIIQER